MKRSILLTIAGMAALVVAGANAAPPNVAAYRAAAERKALKDPAFCGRSLESVVYTCRFGSEHWSMCNGDTGVVLRRLRGGRILERIYSTDGPVSARLETTFDGLLTEYTLSKGAARYTVFDRESRGSEMTGVRVRVTGKPDRELICTQHGDFNSLDRRAIPTPLAKTLP